MNWSYEEYIRSDEWKALARAARARAGFRCEFCGGEPEHVHHVRYPKEFRKDSLDNLIVVCSLCHNHSHGIRGDVAVADIEKFVFPATQGDVREVRVTTCNGANYFHFDDVYNALAGSAESVFSQVRKYRAETNTSGQLNPKSHLLNRLDEDEWKRLEIPYNGKKVSSIWVTEHGVYGLALTLDTPECKRFRRWLKHEVLPTLHRTGTYAMRTDQQAQIMDSIIEFAQAHKNHHGRLNAHDTRLSEHESKIAALTDSQSVLLRKIDARIGETTQTAAAFISSNKLRKISAADLGKKATEMAIAQNVKVEKVSDPRFGQVNIYPIPLLEEAAKVLIAAQDSQPGLF